MKDTKNKGTVRVNANIPKAHHQKLLRFCKANGCTIAGIIRKTLAAVTQSTK